MNNDLKQYKVELGKLSINEQKLRDIYLRKLAMGELQGPSVGYASIDKPSLKFYDLSAFEKEAPKCSIYDAIYENNKNYLNNNAIQYFNKYITYKELFDNIEKCAKAFKQYGIKKGDVVNVSLPNMPESVYIFYALSKIGAVANMIDPRVSVTDLSHYINDVDYSMLIIIEDAISKVYPILENTKLKNVIKISASNSIVENNNIECKNISDGVVLENYNSFLEKGKKYKGNTRINYEPNLPVVIEHTGGTTGIPKGVLLSNDAINMIAFHFIVSGLKFTRDQKWLNIMPPFIAYGVGNGLHLPLLVGMCVVEVPKFEPDKIDELIAHYNPNNFTGVPIHYESIIKSKKIDNIDFSKWVLPGVGGDTIDTQLEIEANKFLKSHNATTKVIKGYGLTEVCAAACVTFGEANELGSVGIPFIKNNISIFEKNEDGEYIELGYNERGEICINSPSVMLEYINNKEETKKVLRKHEDGKIWMHTGDVGYITKDGLIYIDGRTKRIIIRYDGFKIFPFGIEKLILSLDEVEACKVVGTPDVEHIQGMLPQVNVIIKEEYLNQKDTILEKVKKLCEENLADYSIPVEYKSIKKFPRTPIGKIDYTKMEELNKKRVLKK